MPSPIDLSGRVVGKLRVIGRGEDVIRADGRKRRTWRCKCQCGSECTVLAQSLTKRVTASCGCLIRDHIRRVGYENRTHGMSESITYVSWMAMRARCGNPKNNRYHLYGARGIRVCKRWNSFENFLSDMGERPSLKHSIDRIDNDKDYEPSNCRWATQKQQQNNRRNNRPT